MVLCYRNIRYACADIDKRIHCFLVGDISWYNETVPAVIWYDALLVSCGRWGKSDVAARHLRNVFWLLTPMSINQKTRRRLQEYCWGNDFPSNSAGLPWLVKQISSLLFCSNCFQFNYALSTFLTSTSLLFLFWCISAFNFGFRYIFQIIITSGYFWVSGLSLPRPEW